MAIDTRNKRGSVIGIDRGMGAFPNPDGSLANANDRAHMAWKYAGTLAGGAAVIFRKTLFKSGTRVGTRQVHF